MIANSYLHVIWIRLQSFRFSRPSCDREVQLRTGRQPDPATATLPQCDFSNTTRRLISDLRHHGEQEPHAAAAAGEAASPKPQQTRAESLSHRHEPGPWYAIAKHPPTPRDRTDILSLACWASAGFNTSGCAAVEQTLRACMDKPKPPPRETQHHQLSLGPPVETAHTSRLQEQIISWAAGGRGNWAVEAIDTMC